MSKIRSTVIVFVLAALVAACAGSPGIQSSGSEPVIVFADPQFELLYQAALSNNPQWTGADLQKRQMFYFQYGGDTAEKVYADALAQSGIVYVDAAAVLALKNPPAWLYAFAVYTGANAILAMNAQQAANLSLPTIPVEDLGEQAKVLLLVPTVMAMELEVELYAGSVYTDFQRIQAVEATLKGGKLFDERVGPIIWTVSSGLIQCIVDIQIWHIPSNNKFVVNNQESPKSSPCDKEFIRGLINQLVRQGIEAGVTLELMNEIGDFIMKSIATKFGW